MNIFLIDLGGASLNADDLDIVTTKYYFYNE